MFKFVGRKRVGMLFLCLLSAAVFVWVLYVGKGEDSQEGNGVHNISVNESMSISDSSSLISTANIMGFTTNLVLPPPPPSYFLGYILPPGHPCNSFTLPPPPADKKRIGPRPCPVCYLLVDEAIGLMPKFPSPSPVLKNLTFIYEENLSKYGEFGGSDFGGYPTLRQRNVSFDIESMSVHCGLKRENLLLGICNLLLPKNLGTKSWNKQGEMTKFLSYGFVDYHDRASAALAIMTLRGRQLYWAYANSNREGTSGYF